MDYWPQACGDGSVHSCRYVCIACVLDSWPRSCAGMTGFPIGCLRAGNLMVKFPCGCLRANCWQASQNSWCGRRCPCLCHPYELAECCFMCWYILVGLARTVYIRTYTPYIWWFLSQKYRMYTVYVWFWPTLHIRDGPWHVIFVMMTHLLSSDGASLF
jgi:hypothetical protein